MQDRLGIEILPTDTVTVTAWGIGARLADCGTRSKVVRLNRKRVVILDADGRERAISTGELIVARRDGMIGHEGNRS